MTKTTDGLSSSGASGASSSKLTPVQREGNNMNECYCRQYSNWIKNNPKKIVNWRQTVLCPSMTDDYNKYSTDSNYTAVDYDTYKTDVKKDCENLCVVTSEAELKGHSPGDYSLNDCLDILPDSVDSKIRKQLGTILRNEHNLLNKIAQRNVNIELAFEPTNGILLNLDNNLANNISLNKRKLINKARNVNTKKRMLLYDEETDRLYRMIIYILKFLLLVISIVTIKLIYDY